MTKADFADEYTRRHLFQTMSELLALNIVPIVNTNDAVAAPPQVYDALEGVSFHSKCLPQSISNYVQIEN